MMIRSQISSRLRRMARHSALKVENDFPSMAKKMVPRPICSLLIARSVHTLDHQA
jgi:hypothetical protein